MNGERNKEQPLPGKRSQEQPSEEGAPAWMATFADLMSLLLTFFVLLLSFANTDIHKFQDMIGSIKDAFGVQVKRDQDSYIAFSPSRFERDNITMTPQNREALGLNMALQAALQEDETLKKNVDFQPDDTGLLMRIGSEVMFAPGSAVLAREAEPVLQQVIKVMGEHNLDLVIRGHTDDVLTSSSMYPSNWELSSARAAAAVRYILEHSSISPFRLKAVGYAGTRPLLPNTSVANRRANRRVEFYFKHPDLGH
ncbi:flagellar motor protein MotB [Desulfoplanes formicivorans]|uniref:Flagellar motor protein MotB n=1 Tax=Desulfoplanes formicivorans TaxID=1592317 RepID=A0A194AGS1_9BACT|nr:flagellar motor protein MotB [Desulfoplanes formicivorans]GAU07974.1 flagellar motor protein MotB [Desulfoplanes formicivorans]